jgi:hypothetical protein
MEKDVNLLVRVWENTLNRKEYHSVGFNSSGKRHSHKF